MDQAQLVKLKQQHLWCSRLSLSPPLSLCVSPGRSVSLTQPNRSINLMKNLALATNYMPNHILFALPQKHKQTCECVCLCVCKTNRSWLRISADCSLQIKVWLKVGHQVNWLTLLIGTMMTSMRTHTSINNTFACKVKNTCSYISWSGMLIKQENTNTHRMSRSQRNKL